MGLRLRDRESRIRERAESEREQNQREQERERRQREKRREREEREKRERETHTHTSMLGRTSGLPGRHGCCQCQLGKEGAAWRSVRRFRTARISASASSSSASQSSSSQYRRDAGPGDAAPSYEDIDNFPLNKVFFTLFRKKVSENVGYDSPVEGYEGLMEVTRVLNTKFKSREEITAVSKAILVSLFPSWLPPAFRVMFAQPFPEFSLFMNAWVTALCCQWLMGKTTVNEVEVLDEDGKTTRMVPGVKVERCRYLEEAGCAAVCMNSCKFPTQEFFIEGSWFSSVSSFICFFSFFAD